MLDRRAFLTALGTALVAAPAGARGAAAAADRRLFISACLDPSDKGAASVAAFDGDGRLVFATRLPSRGHDATARPGSVDVVVFARRPGNWAAVVDRTSGSIQRIVTTPPDRHFFGHGAFSADGRLLYATENRIAPGDPHIGEGVLGIYDAAAAYRRVGEMPTFGLGPHDLAFLPDRDPRRIVVANGGTITQPGSGREILNAAAMRPSLALVDVHSGAAVAKVELGPDLHGLSIRHLAVAADGEAVFACQWEGDPADGPLLVGALSPDGRTRFFEMPDDDLAALANYVGSVSLDASERVVAATCPRGNTVAFFERRSGRFLARHTMSDVCGVAPASAAGAEEAGIFVLSSGHGSVVLSGAERADLTRLAGTALGAYAWDNHILPI